MSSPAFATASSAIRRRRLRLGRSSSKMFQLGLPGPRMENSTRSPSNDTSGSETSPSPCVKAAVRFSSGALGDDRSLSIRSPPAAKLAASVGLPSAETWRLANTIGKSPSTTIADETLSSSPPQPPSASSEKEINAEMVSLYPLALAISIPPLGVSSAGRDTNLSPGGCRHPSNRGVGQPGKRHSWARARLARSRFPWPATPLSWISDPLDRWLCVPAFRRVCLCQRRHGCQRANMLSSDWYRCCAIGRCCRRRMRLLDRAQAADFTYDSSCRIRPAGGTARRPLPPRPCCRAPGDAARHFAPGAAVLRRHSEPAFGGRWRVEYSQARQPRRGDRHGVLDSDCSACRRRALGDRDLQQARQPA